MNRSKKKKQGAYKETQYTVIIFSPGRPSPAKYRKCELERPETYSRFLAFLDEKYAGWTAVNVYGGLTRKFLRQITQQNR